MSDDTIDKIFTNIEKKRANYSEILSTVVKILPIDEPTADSKLPMTKVLKWAQTKMKTLGGFVTVSDLGFNEFNGVRKRISPVLHGLFRSSIRKPTVCVYGHLESFPTDKNGCDKSENDLFGRGVVDAKGSLLCWFYAIQLYKSMDVELPVNIRFLIENMKDYEEKEFMKYLRTNRSLLFEGIRYICVPYSPVLEGTKPLITYGYRGCCRFNFTVEGGKGHLDSGKYSGAVPEVMTDVIALLNSLVNSKGEIFISGINKDVTNVTPDEEKACHASSFSIADYKKSTKTHVLLHKENKKSVLMHRTRFPSVSIHRIETEESSNDNLIPSKASANFTVTIVPHQRRQDVYKCITNHLTQTFKNCKSKNKLTIEMPLAIKYWQGDFNDNNYKAVKKAVRNVMKEEPEFVRRGTFYATVADLNDVVETISIAMLPVGYADTSGALCVKSDVRTFMDGVKIVASYINELSKL